MLDRTAWGAVFEAAICAVGLVLLWRLVLRPQARTFWKIQPLPEWTASTTDILTVLFFTISFWFLASVGSALALKPSTLSDDHKVILQSAASELGLLAGVVVFAVAYPGALGLPRIQISKTIAAGIATYFIVIPVVLVVGAVWTALLSLVGLPVEKQPAIELFSRTKEYPWLALLVAVAVVLAPIAEELLFRVVLFRYFRTRLPRWVAFVAPACLFAMLHLNLASFAQLVALAIVFSFAYERTGQIGTSMVAHALFNLSTVVLLLLGINL